MNEKANKNRLQGLSNERLRGFGGKVGLVVFILALALLTMFMAGLWYGGWLEAVKLRVALREVPDINHCFE